MVVPWGLPKGGRRWEGGSGICISRRAAGAVAAGAGTCPTHHVRGCQGHNREEDAVSAALPQDRWGGHGKCPRRPKKAGQRQGAGDSRAATSSPATLTASGLCGAQWVRIRPR